MFGDLKNPVKTTAEATPGLFRKAGRRPRSIPAGDRLGLADPQPRRLVQGAVRTGRASPRKAKLWSYLLQEHD